MSDDVKGAIITALIAGIIQIIGFIVMNHSMKKSFENELKRNRDSIALDKMSIMPFEVLQLMDELIGQRETDVGKRRRQGKTEPNKRINELLNTIYAYGSENAIKIAAWMMKEIYASNENADKTDNYRFMSIFILLATQIKFDVTAIAASPELWFQSRIRDYSKHKEQIKAANNELVTELGLRKGFKIS